MSDAKRYPVLNRKAVLSEDRVFRYWLLRSWEPTRMPVMFIGLNPSTADETEDDATIRRCVRFARDWDAGGVIMCNLYALRSTDPRGLWAGQYQPVGYGRENDHSLQLCALRSRFIVAAWGATKVPGIERRAEEVRKMLTGPGKTHGHLRCLGVTQDGHPKHPLRLRADTEPELWTPRDVPIT